MNSLAKVQAKRKAQPMPQAKGLGSACQCGPVGRGTGAATWTLLPHVREPLQCDLALSPRIVAAQRKRVPGALKESLKGRLAPASPAAFQRIGPRHRPDQRLPPSAAALDRARAAGQALLARGLATSGSRSAGSPQRLQRQLPVPVLRSLASGTVRLHLLP